MKATSTGSFRSKKEKNSPLGTPGPYESVLNGFGKVLAPVVGAFAEMSSDVHLLTDLIASAQAADHCEDIAALPSEIKGMFLIRARRGFGLTAHRGWAHLLIDRMDIQMQRPEFPSRGAQPRPLHRTTRLWTPTTTTTPPSGFNAAFCALRARCFFAG